MNALRICIHIGLSKTATTTLQNRLFAHHHQIEYLGKFNRPGRSNAQKFRDPETGRMVRTLLSGHLDQKRIEALASLFKEKILPRLDTQKLLLLSSEGISTGRLENRIRRAQNLRAILGPCKIVIALREPFSLIESLYFEKLKEFNLRPHPLWIKCPRYFSVDQWLGKFWTSVLTGPLWHLDYYRTICAFSDVFGRENLAVLLFEQLMESPLLFLEDLCSFLNVDYAESLRLTADGNDNVRWSEIQIERLKKIQTSWLDSFKYRFANSVQRRQILGLGDTGIAGKDRRAKAEISEMWKKCIGDYTRPGNNALIKEFGLPLERYGYPL